MNTFFETFMEADNDMEIDAKGDVKFKANVRRFKIILCFNNFYLNLLTLKGEEDNPELKRPNQSIKNIKLSKMI